MLIYISNVQSVSEDNGQELFAYRIYFQPQIKSVKLSDETWEHWQWKDTPLFSKIQDWSLTIW